jgi:quinol monooxygenase YgiN
MTLEDSCVSIQPYFRVPAEREQEVMELCKQFVDRTSQEPLCLYYGFTKAGDILHCREGYKGAAGAMAHLENVGELLQTFMQLCELTKLEVHGSHDELEKLRPALTALPVVFFELQLGFRR